MFPKILKQLGKRNQGYIRLDKWLLRPEVIFPIMKL